MICFGSRRGSRPSCGNRSDLDQERVGPAAYSVSVESVSVSPPCLNCAAPRHPKDSRSVFSLSRLWNKVEAYA